MLFFFLETVWKSIFSIKYTNKSWYLTVYEYYWRLKSTYECIKTYGTFVLSQVIRWYQYVENVYDTLETKPQY